MIRANGAVVGALGSAVAGAAGLYFGILYGIWEGASPLAGFFPALAGSVLCCFGVLVAAKEHASPANAAAPSAPSELRRVLGYLAGLLAFAFLMEPLGAIPMIALMLLWLLAGVERLAWQIVLPVTIGSVFGAWLLFDRLLQVPLPRGPFG